MPISSLPSLLLLCVTFSCYLRCILYAQTAFCVCIISISPHPSRSECMSKNYKFGAEKFNLAYAQTMHGSISNIYE